MTADSALQEVTKRQSEEVSKPVTVFLYEEARIRELFRGLKLADCSRFPVPEEESHLSSTVIRDPRVVSEVMTCSHCGASFADRADQVQHYKTDLHKYNVLRSARGQVALSEGEFSKLDVEDGVLSVSGSESESDADGASDADRDSSSATDAAEGGSARPRRRTAGGQQEQQRNQLKRHTKLFLTNASRQMFCLYKCLIMSKWVPTGDTQVELAVKRLAQQPQVAVLMLAGGHFAAAVFVGGKPTLHKTFHAYTIRAKQGGSQAAHDGRTHSAARSAGASLRRYNQASLVQHIQSLLAGWESALRSCTLLFVRALGSASAALFSGKTPPLSRRDPRIRPVPFVTRRPTHAEVMRVYTELSTVQVFGTDVDVDLTQVPQSPPKPDAPARTPRRPVHTDTSATTPDLSSPGTPPSEQRRRMTARDRRDQQRQLQLQLVAEPSCSEEEEVEGEYEVRQLRGLADLSTFGPEEGFDSSRPLDDPVVTAVEERRRRREFRRRLRELQRAADSPGTESGKGAADPAKPGTGKSAETGPSAATPAEEEPESEASSEYRVQCYSLCKTGDAAALSELLADEASPLAAVALLRHQFGPAAHTLLHTAARAAHPHLVRLLLEQGADPTLRDVENRTPYDVASNKEVRNEFRRYRAQHPQQYNYAKAHVPQPLTKDMEQQKQEREADRRKQANLRRKQRLQEKKAQLKVEQEEKQRAHAEEEERRRYLALSDREKRALAAERRLRAQATEREPAVPPPVLVRCFSCAADITGRVPFSYADNVFCSTACVKRHRAGNSQL